MFNTEQGQLIRGHIWLTQILGPEDPVQVPNNLVLGVIVVQILDKYMTIRYLDPKP